MSNASVRVPFPPLLPWARLRDNSCARQLPGFCFPGSSLYIFWVPPRMQPLALGAVSTPPLGAPRKWGKKGETIMYLNHVQLIGFLGKDPVKRQVRGNGANFTVLSVATQQSWKDSNDEWQSKTEWHRVVA